MTPRQHPPFQITATESTVAALCGGLRAMSLGGKRGENWLRDGSGNTFLARVNQRDLEARFEVFSLMLLNSAELESRIKERSSFRFPEDFPAALKHLVSREPAPLIAPDSFEPWPFEEWRTDVLYRVEFIVEGAAARGAIGSTPNIQDAARPGEVPADAAACCEVAAGLLFTGRDGGRLLLAVDWFPFDMIVSRDPHEIDDFRAVCEARPHVGALVDEP